MASTGVVSVSKLALVFALTCCLVHSEEQRRIQRSIVPVRSKTGPLMEGTPEVVPCGFVTKVVTGDCLSGEEAKVCHNASLPMLVFVVGIEGSGHHLISSLLGGLSSVTPQRQYMPSQHIYDPSYDVTTLFYSIIEKELYEQRLDELTQLMDSAQKKDSATLVFASSFPMGLHSGMYSTARPDLIDLKDFECKLYRIKFLVARRHPLAAVMSAVRRFGYRVSDYGGFERIPPDQRQDLNETVLRYTATARIAEDNLIYIDQQVRHLGCHQVHFVDYGDLLNKTTRENSLQKLATFLELNKSDRNALLSAKFAKSNTKVTIPPQCTQCIEKTLYDFFEERKMMWPLLHPH